MRNLVDVRRLMVGVLAVLAVGLAVPAMATAAVTTYYANDATDSSSTPTDCIDPGNTDCALRSAILKANAVTSGTVTINVPTETYTLTMGELDLNASVPVTISGVGAGSTTISGGGTPTTITNRVFTVISGPVTMSGLTIANGSCGCGGGGIDVANPTSVTIDSSTISDNTSEGGGGVFVVGGVIRIDSSTISGNVVTDSGSGGGVEAGGGTVTITNSTISGNHAETGTGSGGGVEAAGGSFSFFADTISTNIAAFVGGGFDNSGRGSDSFVNTTIFGNSAGFDGGGIEPGAIFSDTGTLPAETISFSTITDNSSSSGGGNIGSGQDGVGGAMIDDSIVARGAGTPANCAPGRPGIISNGYNLFDDTADFGAQCHANGTTDVVSASPGLDTTLANNGGPTLTEALLSGSPAIDGANPDNGSCTSITQGVDQRGAGFTRPQNGRCDIGAFEVQVGGGGGGFVPSPDLSLTASAQNNPMTAGDKNTVTDTITNTVNGSTASNVTFTDLAAGFAINSVTPSQGTCTNTATSVSCTLGTLPGGQSATVQINLTASSPGTITLNSSVAMDQTDPTPADNTAMTLIKVLTPPDLALSAAVQKNPSTVGDQGSVMDTITNSGEENATNVQFTDPAAGFTINQADPSQGTCTHTDTTVSCSLGTMGPGATATVEIILTADSAGTVTLNSSVSMDQTDPTPADNSATAQLAVSSGPDLALTASAAKSSIFVGQQDTVTDVIRNVGGENATNVGFTDPAAGFDIVSVSTPQGSCTHTTATVSCSLGTLTPAQLVNVKIVLVPTSAGTVTLSSAVSMAEADPTPPDNTAQVTVNAIERLADLAVNLAASLDPVPLGQSFTYALVVSNYGPNGANNVSVTDRLPSEVKLVSVSPASGFKCAGTVTVTCQKAAMRPSTAGQILIHVTAVQGGTVLDAASVTDSSPTDPNLANNDAQVRVIVLSNKPVVSRKPTVSIAPLGPACHKESSVFDIRATAIAPAGLRALRINLTGPAVPSALATKKLHSFAGPLVRAALQERIPAALLLAGRTYHVVATVVDVKGQQAQAKSHFTICKTPSKHGFTG